jgi:hypothetical protein
MNGTTFNNQFAEMDPRQVEALLAAQWKQQQEGEEVTLDTLRDKLSQLTADINNYLVDNVTKDRTVIQLIIASILDAEKTNIGAVDAYDTEKTMIVKGWLSEGLTS